MRASLERRLCALEIIQSTTADPLVIMIVIVTPGRPVGPALTATFDDVRLTRCDDESETQFMDRVRLDVLSRYPAELGRPYVIVDDLDAQ